MEESRRRESFPIVRTCACDSGTECGRENIGFEPLVTHHPRCAPHTRPPPRPREIDPDEDDYPSSGGSNGDDFGADDY